MIYSWYEFSSIISKIRVLSYKCSKLAIHFFCYFFLRSKEYEYWTEQTHVGRANNRIEKIGPHRCVNGSLNWTLNINISSQNFRAIWAERATHTRKYLRPSVGRGPILCMTNCCLFSLKRRSLLKLTSLMIFSSNPFPRFKAKINLKSQLY